MFTDSDEVFSLEDPMMVLMECMRMMNFRLIDMFRTLDRDNSHAIEFKEFKEGLLVGQNFGFY